MDRPVKTVMFSYLQLSNAGCEIIVRGTIAFLRQALPNYELRILVPSYRPERDRALLSDVADVDIIPMLRWKRYLRGVLRQTRRFDKYWSPRFATRYFSGSDLFVSIGGDIYTIYDGDLPDDWLGYESFATRRGIPSIMFGANMERFEDLPTNKHQRLLNHLARFKLLAVRDQATVEYLDAQDADARVEVYPDPVFSLRPKAVVRPIPVKTIGLNLSPIATQKFGEQIVDQYAAIVSQGLENGFDFHFIPHVYASDGNAGLDDRLVLKRVYDRVDPAFRDRVALCDDALGYQKVSAAIARVDVLVGARMHACLNALTLGKAVFFLEYSKKARAMVDWLAAETPFSDVSSIFRSAPVDAVTFDDLIELIAARDNLASTGAEEIVIDMAPHLAKSSVGKIVQGLAL